MPYPQVQPHSQGRSARSMAVGEAVGFAETSVIPLFLTRQAQLLLSLSSHCTKGSCAYSALFSAGCLHWSLGYFSSLFLSGFSFFFSHFNALRCGHCGACKLGDNPESCIPEQTRNNWHAHGLCKSTPDISKVQRKGNLNILFILPDLKSPLLIIYVFTCHLTCTVI